MPYAVIKKVNMKIKEKEWMNLTTYFAVLYSSFVGT